MAEAYDMSPRMGQLAVSYVVRNYCKSANFLLTPLESLGEAEVNTMLLLKEDLSAAEEAERSGFTRGTIGQHHRKLYRKAGIPAGAAGRMTAMRLAVENDIFPVLADPEGQLPDKCSSYDIATFDLIARGVTPRRASRLTGSEYGSLSALVLPRVVNSLGLPPHRRARGVLRMYEVGVFEKGLIRRLDDFPEVVKNFDKWLGPNHPFTLES